MELGEMQAIADTLMRVVAPDMSPRQLLKAVKKAHPKASKKDIARAGSSRSFQTRTKITARPRTFKRSP